jgi:hypothetical protein
MTESAYDRRAMIASRPRSSLAFVGAGLMALLLVPGRAAGAQEAAATEQVDGAMFRASAFGEDLTNSDALALLREMEELVERALASSREAEGAVSVAQVREVADHTFEMVWGQPSGLGAAGAGEVAELGWKEHWQVTGAEFDLDFVERLGTEPPRITDPRALGVMGRGRAVRGRLEVIGGGSVQAYWEPEDPADRALASLNNVIGWTYLTTGIKSREVQPRVSLTHLWDAPREFWQSTAVTGWLAEAYAQAVNILKTDYAEDVAEARAHVAGLTGLLEKVLDGEDADGDGEVTATAMEGGLRAAVRAAEGRLLAGAEVRP